MIQAGKKRAYCEIQQPTKQPDGQGGNTLSWSHLDYEWFEARPLKESRTLENGGMIYVRAVEFSGCRRSDLTITEDCRIVWNGDNYTIHSIIPTEKLDFITILAYA